jgi:hypothetical protein
VNAGRVRAFQRQPHLPHGIDIRRPEGDVIQNAGAGNAGKEPGRVANVDHVGIRGQTPDRALGCRAAIAEAGQKVARSRRAFR